MLASSSFVAMMEDLDWTRLHVLQAASAAPMSCDRPPATGPASTSLSPFRLPGRWLCLRVEAFGLRLAKLVLAVRTLGRTRRCLHGTGLQTKWSADSTCLTFAASILGQTEPWKCSSLLEGYNFRDLGAFALALGTVRQPTSGPLAPPWRAAPSRSKSDRSPTRSSNPHHPTTTREKGPLFLSYRTLL